MKIKADKKIVEVEDVCEDCKKLFLEGENCLLLKSENEEDYGKIVMMHSKCVKANKYLVIPKDVAYS